MAEKAKFQKCSWSEGLVGKKTEYIEITYKENSDPVALIGKGDGTNFIVQFLIIKELLNNKEIFKAVSRDIDYYLIVLEEKDPWRYAQHHCTTSSNLYSDVHWCYCK